MISLQENPRLNLFSAEGMNTTFVLRLDTSNRRVAEEAASACFNQLEELESELSRFRPDSDVSRINALGAGEALLISERTYACLRKAAEAQSGTAGLFDVALGAGSGQLELAPDRPLVTCRAPGRRVDLGGIGKGFALDQLAHTLVSYALDSALLAAGSSTLLAVGTQVWPVVLAGDTGKEPLALTGRALSASGTGIQGAHVVHPDEPNEEPRYRFRRVWLLGPDAALADAFSTACLLMAVEELEAFAEVHRGELDIYVEGLDEPGIRRVGPTG